MAYLVQYLHQYCRCDDATDINDVTCTGVHRYHAECHSAVCDCDSRSFTRRVYVSCDVCLMRRYQKAGKLGSNVRVSDIVKHLNKRKGESLYVQAKFVVDTLNRYMSSADDLITTAHVPHRMMDKSGGLKHVEHSVRMVRH